MSPTPDRESSLPDKQIFATVTSAVIVGVGYYLGTRVGFALTPSGQPNSAFWPPNAFLLAALLLARRRVWWTLFIAVIPAHLLAQLQAGVPVWTAAAWLLTNTSEALIGAFCITQFVQPTKVFDSVRGVSLFVIFGVLVAPFATSFLDAAGVVLTGWGHGYLPLGAERFWTNAFAELSIVPIIVLCGSYGASWIRKATLSRYCEGGLLGLSIAIATVLVFHFQPGSPSTTPALLFIPLLLLIWAAARFGVGGLSICGLIVGLTAIFYAMHGQEPFPNASLRQNILSLQILLCSVVLPLIFLSAFMNEARNTQASLRQISVSLIEAQEQERARIGRELHDDITQRLAMLAIELDQLPAYPSDLQSRARELRRRTTEISNDVQALSHDLHSSKLEYLGVAGGIKSWCKEFSERQNVEIDFATDVSSVLPLEVGVCFFRVVQEALHNAIKHGGAKRVEVRLMEYSNEIHLVISDAGRGFDVETALQGKGLGLTSMRERVRLVNGIIAIESKPMAGTTIRARVPFKKITAGS
jgi:signal transduction histidine kinase